MKKILASVAILMISELGVCLDAKEVQSWEDDIAHYKRELELRHIDLYHTLSEESFNAHLDEITDKFSTMSEHQVVVELMRLTHMVGDGHTSFPLWGRETHNYPYQIRIVEDKALVVGVAEDYAHLLGSELTAVNAVPVKSVIEDLSQLAPFSENQFSTRIRAADYLRVGDVLVGLGIVENFEPVSFDFTKGGRSFESILEPKQDMELRNFLDFRDADSVPIEGSIDENTWFGSPDEGNTVYILFRRYPDYRSMERFSRKVLKYIDKNESNNLIIDLRENYGGNFFVGLQLAQQLVLADTVDWLSGVYVLIDNQTFSAAMNNAAQYKQILNARLVGQPSGAKPTGYQDMGQFSLPNSSLVVTYSKRLYRFSDGSPDALHPDTLIPLTREDYLRPEDRVLDFVMSDIRSRRRER